MSAESREGAGGGELLEKCGHRPWIEREAKERFYEILKQEIQ